MKNKNSIEDRLDYLWDRLWNLRKRVDEELMDVMGDLGGIRYDINQLEKNLKGQMEICKVCNGPGKVETDNGEYLCEQHWPSFLNKTIISEEKKCHICDGRADILTDAGQYICVEHQAKFSQ